MAPKLPRTRKRRRSHWGPESVHFFALLRKPIPIPSGAGLIFATPDDPAPYAADTDVEEARIPPLDPPAPDGVSLRFWEVNKSQTGAYEAMEQISTITSLVVPRFSPRRDFGIPDDDDKGAGGLTATVVEMATPLPPGKDAVQLSFRRCLTCLEDVSRAYAIATRSMIPPLRVADVHPFVLFISRSPGRMGRWRLGFSLYLIPTNFEAEYLGKDWEHADQEALRALLFRLREGDPILLFAERLLIAKAEASAGEFGGAVLEAAIAAEILLDALLGLMLWEERPSEVVAAAVLAKSVSERLRSEYHGRLGGNWDQDGSGEIGAWRRNLANLRNRVVHAGYRPSEEEAMAAIGAAAALEEFVAERAVQARYRYWRTVLMFVGTPGLQRRGLWSRRMQDMLSASMEQPSEWHRTYAEWRMRVEAHT